MGYTQASNSHKQQTHTNNKLKNLFKNQSSFRMSDSTPNTGGSLLDKAGNLVNQGIETAQSYMAGSEKEANKEKAKGNVPGNDSISDRISGATGAISNKMDESSHDAKASANEAATKNT